jgi:AbrB family looped-hinge helix DNA binding protein
MAIVTISSKYQVVIPKDLRKKLKIRAGQKVSAVEENGHVALVPVPDDPIEYLCGAAEGEPSMTQALLEERARDLEHE